MYPNIFCYTKNRSRKRKSVFAAVMINFILSADEVVAYPEYRNIQ